jgi:ribosomal protein S14
MERIEVAVLSEGEARKERARRGQAKAVEARPRCRRCGKKNMSAKVRFDDAAFTGSMRRCRSCGHEQGIINGKIIGKVEE